jgi:hypothetical protein
LKQINFILLCFAFIIGKAQSPYFDKYYKLGYTVGVTQNLLKLQDSSYIAFAIVNDSATGRQDCGFLKMDKQGNEVTKRVINFQNTHYVWQERVYTDMVQISPSSFIKLGVNFYNSSPIDLVLSKINTTTLDTVQNKYFSDNYYYYAYGILKLHANKFFLIGTKSNTLTNDYWPNLIEMDSSFNFTASYDVPLTNSIMVTDVKLNETSKKIILSGYKPNTGQFGALVTIDTLGNFINLMIDSSSTVIGYNQVLYSNFDNTYVTFGAKKTGNWGGNSLTRLYVCKYNATTLVPIWRKTYGKAQMINNLYDAVLDLDGSIVASGGYADSVSNMTYANCNTNGVLLKLNPGGDSLWMRQFDNYGLQPPAMPWDELLNGIEKTSNGGYIACGLPYYKPNPKVWVIRVDSNGCFNSSCAPSNVGLDEYFVNNIIDIFPNPADEEIHLSLKTQTEYQTFSIYNSIGQFVHEEKTGLNGSQKSLKTSHLPPGIYFLRAKDQNGLTLTKRFVICR